MSKIKLTRLDLINLEKIDNNEHIPKTKQDSDCGKKKKFLDKTSAEGFIQFRNGMKRNIPGHFRAYKCPFCRFWHNATVKEVK